MRFEETDSWDRTVNYNNFFCLECRHWLINQNVELGVIVIGVIVIAEVNERYYFHRKYHRGRRP